MVQWLSSIARQMGSEKEFLIERMQPRDWLKRSTYQWHYRLIFGLIFGLKTDIKVRTRLNQGIWNSLQNMLITCGVGLVFTLLLYVVLSYSLPFFLGQRLASAIMAGTLPLPILMTFFVGGGLA